ncbi:MAG TPA: ThuA domain-containing protein [Humisphaera sp.]
MQPTRSWFAPTRRRLLAAAAALGLSMFVPAGLARAADDAAAQQKPAKKVKVLYLTQSMGFRHQPVTRQKDKDGKEQLASSEVALMKLGEQTGVFEVEPTQDAKVITPEKLAQIDVLAFYTTGALPISADNWKAVQDWIASGKGGFIGIHSATDTGWKYEGPGMDYTKFINGKFAGHPWGQGSAIKVATWDPSHPTVKSWGASADHKDEIYQYQMYDPKAVRVLQSIDFEGTPLKKPYLVPITWVREIGKGRVFYTNFGHTPATWEDPRFKDQLTAAVKWVTHQTDGDATPNPEVQAAWTIHSFIAYGPDGKGVKDGPKPSELVEKLKGADKAWLVATAEKVNGLRNAAPADLKEPKAPNKNDEKKDAKKYADDLAKFEKEKAEFPAKKAKWEADNAKFNDARKAILDEVMAHAK